MTITTDGLIDAALTLVQDQPWAGAIEDCEVLNDDTVALHLDTILTDVPTDTFVVILSAGTVEPIED